MKTSMLNKFQRKALAARWPEVLKKGVADEVDVPLYTGDLVRLPLAVRWGSGPELDVSGTVTGFALDKRGVPSVVVHAAGWTGSRVDSWRTWIVNGDLCAKVGEDEARRLCDQTIGRRTEPIVRRTEATRRCSEVAGRSNREDGLRTEAIGRRTEAAGRRDREDGPRRETIRRCSEENRQCDQATARSLLVHDAMPTEACIRKAMGKSQLLHEFEPLDEHIREAMAKMWLGLMVSGVRTRAGVAIQPGDLLRLPRNVARNRGSQLHAAGLCLGYAVGLDGNPCVVVDAVGEDVPELVRWRTWVVRGAECLVIDSREAWRLEARYDRSGRMRKPL